MPLLLMAPFHPLRRYLSLLLPCLPFSCFTIFSQAYCDLATDGEGWMLTYAYAHDPNGDSNGDLPAFLNEPPTSPNSGFGQVDVAALAG